jgi:TetR/AcrR family transcriptional regulator, tetracycline repressor protein
VPRGVKGGLTSDDVVEAALRVVERDGAGGLTMRRLADELGTAVTAIYWHVGNRDALVELLVQRLLEEMGDVHAAGPDHRSRIAGLATELRQRLLARPHLIALADQRGLTPAMFQPMQSALADELARMGITGRRAGQVIQLLQCHVVASVVLARTIDRSRSHEGTDPRVWEKNPADPELIEALATIPDLDAAFNLGLEALLDRLLDRVLDRELDPVPGPQEPQ